MFCLHPETQTAKRRNLERALLRERPSIQGRRDRLVKKKAAIAANMVARGGFEPPQAASKAAVLTITQPGNQNLAENYSTYSLKYRYLFLRRQATSCG